MQLESSMSRLEQEVKKIQDEVLRNERQYHLTNEQMALNELWLKRAQDELRSYVTQTSNSGKDGDNVKKKSVREQLLKLITEQEKKAKVDLDSTKNLSDHFLTKFFTHFQLLKEEQKRMRENLTLSSKQVDLWTNLEKLFICKKNSVERQMQSDSTVIHREPGTETLVL